MAGTDAREEVNGLHKDRKREIVARMTEEFRSAPAMLVADPSGLSVAEMRDLRVRLRAQGASFRVSKNTLARIAARDAGREELVDLLVGGSGIALCLQDPAPVAKTMSDFARISRKLEVRGGLLDSTRLDAAGVSRLATLPPREQLHGQVVGVVAGPLQALVNVLAAGPRELVVVLDQIIQKRQSEPAAA
jgi:large subunit ribosomal protein L10